MLSFLSNKATILGNIDPDHIYVENIRAFFNIPKKFAKFLCEMAVKERSFTKYYGIECPQCGRMLLSVKEKSDLPEIIECEVCQHLEREKYTFNTSDLDIVEFYKLNR